jgi:surfeit locus 1 family protein
MVLMTKAAASAATSTTAVVSEKVGLSLAGQVFFGSLCAGTFGLGVWQTRRYFEKVDIVAARQAALRQDPTTELPLLDTTADGNGNDAVVFRRIHLQGYYLHDYEFLVGPRGAPAGSLPEKKSASSATTTAAPSQQGYFVLTPFVVTHKVPTTTSLDGNSNNELVVIVNRGWVPRQMAVFPQQQKQSQRQGYANNNNNKNSDEPAPPPRLSTVRRATVRRQDLQQRRQSSSTNKNTDIDYLDWERPSVPPLTSLTVVPAPHEKPRFIVAQHDNVVQRQQQHHQQQQQQQQQHRNGNSSNNNVEDALPPPPPKLFWFDRKAMKEITAASNILSPVQQKMPTLLVLTAVKNDCESDDDNDDNKNVNDKPQQQQQQVLPSHLWPAVPPAHRVGEPKVTPMIHVGYAVTWYGLSAAGLYMTRKLMTRGR